MIHEAVPELVRDHPDFVATLLRAIRCPLPPFTSSSIVDSSLNPIVPTEHRADAVILFGDAAPTFGVVLEAQLAPDEDKLYSWPLYAVSARARHRVPFTVVVITPEPTTKRWASRPIHLGNEVVFKTVVIGPDDIPAITDEAEAMRDPRLAVVSAVVHGREEVATAVAVAKAALAAVTTLRPEPGAVYSKLVIGALSVDARKVLETMLHVEKLLSDADQQILKRNRAEARKEGRAEGEVKAILKILAKRGVSVPANVHERILACRDLELLETWLDRAFVVTSIDELFV